MLQGAVDLIGIATEQRMRLGRLSAIFDVALIEEGQRLVDEISAGGSHARGVKASPDVELRDRLYALAEQRIRKVRAAARFVYRAHPEIARQVASAYRRESRARAAKSTDAPATPTPTV